MGYKIIFVSVPMSGRNNDEIRADIEEAKEKYRKTRESNGIKEELYFIDNLDYVLPGYATFSLKSENIPLAYLGHAIERMAACDDVIFAGNWEEARGCQVEKLVYDLYFKH